MKIIDKLRCPSTYDCINCKHLSTKDYIGCKQHFNIRANMSKNMTRLLKQIKTTPYFISLFRFKK